MEHFDLQPVLENKIIRIEPLKMADFNRLFEVASDPKIWEQHPNPNRYLLADFSAYFEGAMASGGAFLIFDKATETPIGSSRYYDLKPEKSVAIGYTFLARDYWGGKYNPHLKSLMIGHAFGSVGTVEFHIGATNFRSQKAIERLGARKTGEAEVTYYREAPKLNFIYQINKADYSPAGLT